MNRRKQKPPPDETMSYAVWKSRPPGPEQLELERLFKSKEIGPLSTADSVRKSNRMFQQFSSSVFGNHFRATKAKLGACGNIFIFSKFLES